MRLLDLFCGRWGWSKAFVARRWECVGVDLTTPPLLNERAQFKCLDVLEITPEWVKAWGFDFIVASPPCEQFSIHCMKHFHINPPYPELGIRLFNHTRNLCEASGKPYVIENVRCAQQFVGPARIHCGPFYLWGNATPPLVNQGIRKMIRNNGSEHAKFAHLPLGEKRIARNLSARKWPADKKEAARQVAAIPIELANCVASYAERLLEASS